MSADRNPGFLHGGFEGDAGAAFATRERSAGLARGAVRVLIGNSSGSMECRPFAESASERGWSTGRNFRRSALAIVPAAGRQGKGGEGNATYFGRRSISALVVGRAILPGNLARSRLSGGSFGPCTNPRARQAPAESRRQPGLFCLRGPCATQGGITREPRNDFDENCGAVGLASGSSRSQCRRVKGTTLRSNAVPSSLERRRSIT